MARKPKTTDTQEAPPKGRRGKPKEVEQAAAPTRASRSKRTEDALVPVGSGVVKRDRYQYMAHAASRTPSGRTAIDNNDTVADMLRSKSLEEVYEILRQHGGEPKESWFSLNQGLARMAAGNMLRGLLKKRDNPASEKPKRGKVAAAEAPAPEAPKAKRGGGRKKE